MANDYTNIFDKENEHIIFNKIEELSIKGDIYLNHAPKHERYALCQRIKQLTEDLEDAADDAFYTHYKKTSLQKLNSTHRKLKRKWKTFYRKGYFQCKRGAHTESAKEGLRKSFVIQQLLVEIGCMIGGWMRYDARQQGKSQSPES